MQEHTGTGWPDPPGRTGSDEQAPAGQADAPAASAADAADPARAASDRAEAASESTADAASESTADRGAGDPAGTPAPSRPPLRRRVTAAGAVIGLLLGLFGFALVVQLKSNTTDPLAAARPEDLRRIWSDLQAREDRLQQEIAELEESQRQLAQGAQGRAAALEEARRLADELGILAGTLPAEGNGLVIRFQPGFGQPIKASAIVDAVQELRGAGAEAMQIAGADGQAVRIVASTSFVDDDGAILTGGRRLTGPYTVTVIGDPETMRTALSIPGGVVESVQKDGGTVTVQESGRVQVTALHEQGDLRYAQPAS